MYSVHMCWRFRDDCSSYPSTSNRTSHKVLMVKAAALAACNVGLEDYEVKAAAGCVWLSHAYICVHLHEDYTCFHAVTMTASLCQCSRCVNTSHKLFEVAMLESHRALVKLRKFLRIYFEVFKSLRRSSCGVRCCDDRHCECCNVAPSPRSHFKHSTLVQGQVASTSRQCH